MESMNFLSKKYTSVHSVHSLHSAASLSQSRQRSSKTFIPAHNLSNVPSSQQFHLMNGQSHQISANHCQTHPQELLRHLCLDCIELLCSECIGEHISIHRENNTFPNIQTLKQLKSEMQLKLDEITQLISSETHPKTLSTSIEIVRKESCSKLDILHKQINEQVEAWITKEKQLLINNAKYEEIEILQEEMYSMYEEINLLKNSLSSGGSVYDVKKAYQIDGSKLEEAYKGMLSKCKKLSERVRVDVKFDLSKFMEGIENAVSLREYDEFNNEETERKEEGNSIHDEEDESFRLDLPSHDYGLIEEKTDSKSFCSQVPILFNMIPGTNVLKTLEPKCGTYSVHSLPQITSYPLSSLCLLPNNMAVISGGMIAENKKSNLIQIFDYVEQKLVSEYSLSKPRSSHKTIVYEDRIFFIGGFNENNEECCDVEILKANKIQTSQNKCQWGGPNLCTLIGKSIIKITYNGVEIMNVDNGVWETIAIDVSFNISKGMQMGAYLNKRDVEIVIFGDDEFYYLFDVKGTKFKKLQNGVVKPVVSAVSLEGKVYGWVEEGEGKVIIYDGQWKNGF